MIWKIVRTIWFTTKYKRHEKRTMTGVRTLPKRWRARRVNRRAPRRPNWFATSKVRFDRSGERDNGPYLPRRARREKYHGKSEERWRLSRASVCDRRIERDERECFCLLSKACRKSSWSVLSPRDPFCPSKSFSRFFGGIFARSSVHDKLPPRKLHFSIARKLYYDNTRPARKLRRSTATATDALSRDRPKKYIVIRIVKRV